MSARHTAPHPSAGQTVTVTPKAPLFTYVDTEPITFEVDDWNDRVLDGQSWMHMDGHAASLGYAMRAAAAGLPLDNEVVYGHCERGFGHLVHVDEISGGAA